MGCFHPIDKFAHNKINNFRGYLTDIPAITKALLQRWLVTSQQLMITESVHGSEDNVKSVENVYGILDPKSTFLCIG